MITTENISIADRIVIAAQKLSFDRFVLFQEKECSRYGALVEIHVMYKVAERLGVKTIFVFSKYKEFMREVWEAAQTKSDNHG
jgi:hypothetical protein